MLGRERVAVLSHSLWLRQFGGDPAVVGRAVTVNGVDHEIVGVIIVGDIRSAGVYVPAQGVMYMPQAQYMHARDTMSLVVRADMDPAGRAPAARRALAEVEPHASAYRVLTVNQVVDRSRGRLQPA